MGAMLLQVALHIAIMLGRANWHCWSPMHPRPFGTSEPMPRALDPVGCAWTEGSYAQLDIFDWLPEPRSEHQTGNSKLRVACLRSSALVWPLSDIYLSHPVGKLTDFSDSCWAEPPKRPAGCLGKPVVELLRLRDRSLVLITEMSPTDLPCEGCESPSVRYELDLNQELMVAWVRRQDVCGRQTAFPAQRWTEFVVQGMYTYPDYVNSPPADITGNCERQGLVVFGRVKTVNQMIPNARTWAPPGTPLFDAKLRWLGIARRLFLLGEAVDEGPFMVCHRTWSSYEDSNRIVCIPKILRAPECKRGW